MVWGGFPNIFMEGGSWCHDDGRRTRGKSTGQGFTHQVLQSAPKFPSKRIDSKISVVFIPTTMGSVAWLSSVMRSKFKNLQYPKKIPSINQTL